MTWKAGIDAVSLGGTKNGLMGVEACVIFNPQLAWEFELRRKRGGHLFSKHRFLSAQMLAYLTDDLWLDLARRANTSTARLAEGLRQHNRAELLYEPAANVTFTRFPRSDHRRLRDAGASYNISGGDAHSGPDDTPLTARLVTDWSATEAALDTFLRILRQD